MFHIKSGSTREEFYYNTSSKNLLEELAPPLIFDDRSDPSRISLLNVPQSTRIVNVRIPVNDPSEERTFANVRSSFAGR